LACGIIAVPNFRSRVLARVTRLGERERWILAKDEPPLRAPMPVPHRPQLSTARQYLQNEPARVAITDLDRC
jgi:hypothetical protein